MGQEKIMKMGIINIKTHPHSSDKYINLMNDAFRLGRLVKIRGDDWGTTHYLNKTADGEMYGEIYRFLQIDPKAEWLDLRKREPIVDAEGNPIPQVADELKPNTRRILFVFEPNSHRLFFDVKGITPNLMKQYLERMLNDRTLRRTYGEVYVEVEASQEAIERIIKIPTLTRLEIVISRPNDDVYDQAQRFLDKMENRGTRKFRQIETSTRSEGITPDEDTIGLMEVAKSNGMVFAVGYDGSERVEESTIPHPLIIPARYDEERTSLLRTMINEGLRFIDTLKRRNR